ENSKRAWLDGVARIRRKPPTRDQTSRAAGVRTVPEPGRNQPMLAAAYAPGTRASSDIPVAGAAKQAMAAATRAAAVASPPGAPGPTFTTSPLLDAQDGASRLIEPIALFSSCPAETEPSTLNAC